MAFVGWIVSTACLLAGLALRQDQPFAHAHDVSTGLLAAAFLTLPPLWADRPLGIGGKHRLTLCLAMLLALPLVLLPR